MALWTHNIKQITVLNEQNYEKCGYYGQNNSIVNKIIINRNSNGFILGNSGVGAKITNGKVIKY